MVALGDSDASLGKKVFHFTETGAEPIREPDGMVDRLGWKEVTAEAGCVGFHPSSLSNPGQFDNTMARDDLHDGATEWTRSFSFESC